MTQTRNRRFGLSKSKITAFEQCPKKLWLATHRPELAELDEGAEARFATGNAVGEIACALHPAGVMVDPPSLSEALAKTSSLISGGHPGPIFEATFEHDGVLVRVDVLEKVEGGGWAAAEVKSSGKVKDYHRGDLATQVWVMREAGIDLNRNLQQGKCPLFRNFDADQVALPKMRTLLIDSHQLESGDAVSSEFKAAAADEIERFRQEIIQREGYGAADKLTDETILREVMNTVGRPGKLGESIRCVVSVSMLTEGWDTNTVTHVLGVRAFGTQLLCEQVIGRALRRVSYQPNAEGKFDVEYADIFGIPFDFTAQPVSAKIKAPPPMVRVEAISPDRDHSEIRFPRVEGYRTELPRDTLSAQFTDDSTLELTPDLVGATETIASGIIGEQAEMTLDHLADTRPATIQLRLADRIVRRRLTEDGEVPNPALIMEMRKIVRRWMADHLVCIRRWIDKACNAKELA